MHAPVDASDPHRSGLARYINSPWRAFSAGGAKCKANAQFRRALGQVLVFLLRDVQAGEEILAYSRRRGRGAGSCVRGCRKGFSRGGRGWWRHRQLNPRPLVLYQKLSPGRQQDNRVHLPGCGTNHRPTSPWDAGEISACPPCNRGWQRRPRTVRPIKLKRGKVVYGLGHRGQRGW